MGQRNLLSFAAGAALLGAAFFASAPRADGAAPRVLKHVGMGKNVSAVIVVKSLSALSSSIGNLGTTLDMPMIPPDPLGVVLDRMHVTKGLRKNGSAAVVMMFPKPGAPASSPTHDVILLPSSHLRQLLAAMHPRTAAHGITPVTSGNGQTGYAAQEGRFVALCDSRGALAKFLRAKKPLSGSLTRDARDEMANHSVSMYVNMPVIAARVIAALRTKSLRQMNNGAPLNAKERQLLGLAKSAIVKYLPDITGDVATLDFGAKGIHVGIAAQLKPNSSLAQLAGATPALSKTPFAGLPAKRYLMAVAASGNGKAMAQLFTTLLDQQKTGDKHSGLVPLERSILRELSYNKGFQSIYTHAATATKHSGMVRAVKIFQSNHPNKMLKFSIKNLQTAKTIMANLHMRGPMGQPLGTPYAIHVMPGTVDIGGIQFTHMRLTPNRTAAGTAPQQAAIESAMVGASGTDIYEGAWKHEVIELTGFSKAQIPQLLATIKRRIDAISGQKTIQSVQSEVLPHPVLIAYMPIDRWLAAAQQAMAPNQPAPGNGAAGAISPAVASMDISGSNVHGEWFIPNAQLERVTQAAQGLMMMFMGGGAPG